MFRKERKFETTYEDTKYFEEFFDAYDIGRVAELLTGRVRYTVRLLSKEYRAFCEYIGELGLLGVYPILL